MKTTLKILLLAMFPAILFASGGGSIYSRYGAGDVVNYFSARNLALGTIGVTSGQTQYINFINPASLNNLKIVRFETGLNVYGMNVSDNSGSAFYAGSEFSGFSMAFPVEKDLGISIAIGMVPYTTVQYEVQENHINDGYLLNYSGSGGISKAYLSASYKLPFDVSLGFAFNYFTGNIEYNSIVDYQYDNSRQSSSFKKTYNYRGTGFTFGLESGDLSSIFNIDELTKLKFGLVVNYVRDLPTDTTSTISLSNTTGTERTALINTKLPTRIDAGFSFILGNNKRVMADFSYQPWNKYELENEKFANLKAINRFGLGIEFLGEKSMYADALDKIDYRCGISYEETHLKVRGENINQISLHGGFSYPIGMMSTIDVGFQIGQRGTKDFGLIRELFYKANFSLSIGELWFIRIER